MSACRLSHLIECLVGGSNSSMSRSVAGHSPAVIVPAVIVLLVRSVSPESRNYSCLFHRSNQVCGCAIAESC